jgi:hypothetical protein
MVLHEFGAGAQGAPTRTIQCGTQNPGASSTA